MNSSYSYSSDAAGGGAAAALFGAFFLIYMLVVFALIAVVIVGMWKVFVKAGRPGWAAIIPIYNLYILLEIVGRPTWWLAFLLLPLIPFIGTLALFVVLFILYWDVAKSFGKDVGFAIGLTLLGFVFWPMLGFGSARYIGPMASGFGLPDTPGGGYGGGGYAGGGYTPPAQGGYPPQQSGYPPQQSSYTPPAGGYTAPAPTYSPQTTPQTAPETPTYAPPATPQTPQAAPPATPTYEQPAKSPENPNPPTSPA